MTAYQLISKRIENLAVAEKAAQDAGSEYMAKMWRHKKGQLEAARSSMTIKQAEAEV